MNDFFWLLNVCVCVCVCVCVELACGRIMQLETVEMHSKFERKALKEIHAAEAAAAQNRHKVHLFDKSTRSHSSIVVLFLLIFVDRLFLCPCMCLFVFVLRP